MSLAPLLCQIEAMPEREALLGHFPEASAETVAAILEEARRFATAYLEPLNESGDAHGCALVEGRVRTAPGHQAAWAAFIAGGWTSLDQPAAFGGQGLPLFVSLAVQEIFDRACPAFGMMPVPIRSASRLLRAYASPDIRNEWLPKLVAGAWCATICISEPDAGSDIARLRTRAVLGEDGAWRLTGEKQWISFADQDLTARIGHCVLARTAAGLSLFLVPSEIDGVRNHIVIRRIEEKMGLHLSPTCAVGLEGAVGYLLGQDGRGLAQMFVMITNMRLAVGVQGLGTALSAADTAWAYARERRQGGVGAAAVPIIQHPDVQQMLLGMRAEVETLRGLGLAIAAYADIAEYAADETAREDAAALIAWLLPIFKTQGGESGFNVSSTAMQVLGGAGYTKDWPVEQALRDARVLTIFEGTTGIQGLDLLHRRLRRDKSRGLQVFLATARRDLNGASPAAEVFDLLEQAAGHQVQAADAEAGATAFLALASLAATGWIALRLVNLGDEYLQNAGAAWLHGLPGKARAAYEQVTKGADVLKYFGGEESSFL
jgi:alkylation response protein AidB-like acyl-CoA dehydrogenase